MTQVFFVHGMGRSSLSAWPMLRRFRQAGLRTAVFDYCVTCETFDQIVARLRARLTEQAARSEPFVIVAHSLGGVLSRAALQGLPASVAWPQQLFLLGSPVRPSLRAQRLGRHWLFRAITRDCGQLLGSSERMAAIDGSPVPATAIVGTRGVSGRWSPFAGVANDGVVSVAEAEAGWLKETVAVPVVHTLLPASGQVAAIVLDRLGLPVR